MTKLRSPGRRRPLPLEAELAEFSTRPPLAPADPAFREELRAGLWQLLRSLLARLRR
jgi:hypothetical protein